MARAIPKGGKVSRRRTAPATKTSSSVFGILPDHIGPDQLAHLNEGLRFLFDCLRDATKTHRSGINGGREGIVQALKAVTAFSMLFQRVTQEKLETPLYALTNALIALDHNIVEPFMMPTPRSGRSPASEGRQAIKAAVAYTVRRLCDAGIDLASARKLVAKELQRLGVKPGRGSSETKPRTVREWCSAIEADVGRHGAAAQTFDQLLADPRNSELNELLPADVQRILLDRLSDIIGQTRAHEII